jgi:hypothetical protein
MTDMINLEQAQHVEQNVFGSIFIVLVSAHLTNKK